MSHLFGRELAPKRWIFIIGCYNSGTTILRQLLGRHPAIDALPSEGVALTDTLPYPEQFHWPRMWHRCLSCVRLMPGDLPKREIRRIKSHWSLWLSRHYSNVLEKSVANSTRLEFLQEHFFPAYFVHIVRNGVAVAEGIRRRAEPSEWSNPEFDGAYPLELCAGQWCAHMALVESQRQRVERFHELRYEDLTRDPARTLGNIVDFLGVDFLPSDRWREPLTFRGKTQPLMNMNEDSFHNLSSAEVEATIKVESEYLEKYGYC